MTSPHLVPLLDAEPELEVGFAQVLAGVLERGQVPVDSNFFDDLDADSLLMARFCARVRKRDDLPAVSMKDIYRHPTITSLAAAFGEPTPSEKVAVGSVVSPLATPPVLEAVPAVQVEPVAVTARVGTAGYVLCGGLQALIAVAGAYLAATVLDWAFTWLTQAGDLRVLYVRAVELGSAALLGMCLLPIVGKWVLIGRWTPGTIRVWSLGYVRFWCVKTLIRANPLVLFAGSPIYTLYLRLLGAKIGKGVVVYSATPVCTDLLSIGAHTVIRKDAQLGGYRAVAGVIEIGPITLGADVIVGEQTVIDIDTEMGDGARLGHSSSLHAGQRIPGGEYWHGSPARPTEAIPPARVDPVRCGSVRRVLYSLWQLIIPLGVYVPLLLAAPVLLAKVPRLAALQGAGPVMLTHPTYYRDIALITVVISVGFVIANFVFIMIVPRLLNLGLTPGRVYPLYGFRYWLARTITRRTNSAFFMMLVGDSSYVVHYLRALGYDLGQVEQTGSNFGTAVHHDNPYLCSVGTGTMVADGLSMVNIDYSSTSFRLSPVTVGAHSFLGNAIAYPAHAQVGDNCLLATKVMVPADGSVHEGVGLLGAPSFQIPRTVERDHQLEVTDPAQLRRRLAAKNRHNSVTIVLLLVARWVPIFGTVLLGETSDLNASMGAWALTVFSAASTVIGLVYLIMLQRGVNWLQAVRPGGCSIYDRAFWRHERYWKIPGQAWMQAFNGTPFKPLIWAALGVHIGRRVFDDGLRLVEKSLVTIGDDATLNTGSVIQCHSQEDGAFKSDRTTLGAGVTLGVGAFVHYGVTIDDGVVLAPDTFVMKGEELPAHTRWIGNPAALAIHKPATPASAALPADSAPVAAALTARPRAVAEWDGHRWSFPELEHFSEPLEDQGPVTHLHIDRPGTLRLIGSGDGLRIELIPDDRDLAITAAVGLPLPGDLLALPDPNSDGHRTLRSLGGRGLARTYAAALILIAVIAAAGVLNATHIVSFNAPGAATTCETGTTGCNPSTTPDAAPVTAPGKAPAMAPDPAPDPALDAPDTAPDSAPDEVSLPHTPAQGAAPTQPKITPQQHLNPPRRLPSRPIAPPSATTPATPQQAQAQLKAAENQLKQAKAAAKQAKTSQQHTKKSK